MKKIKLLFVILIFLTSSCGVRYDDVNDYKGSRIITIDTICVTFPKYVYVCVLYLKQPDSTYCDISIPIEYSRLFLPGNVIGYTDISDSIQIIEEKYRNINLK